MAQNNFTCFFISPIGSKYGDEHQRELYEHSNTVLNFLILPALRTYGFQGENVIRADHEATPGHITESIEKHLREDDLCIVDLTGLNANVMYEYGVRVGIGKPVIPITADDPSKIPFDVKDIRTMQYEIETVKGLMDSQNSLGRMVANYVNAGFQPKAGTGSYVELSERLQNIERLLAEFGSSNTSIQTDENAGNVAEIIRKTGGPYRAFNYSLRTRDVQLGEQLMPRLKASLSQEKYIDLVLAQLSALGSKKAAEEMKQLWPYIISHLSLKQQYEEIGSYISYCNRADLEIEELVFITEELSKLDERITASDLDDGAKKELRAGVYNQTNRVHYGAYATANRDSDTIVHEEWLQIAIDSLKKAVALVPDDASYHYNLAMCLDRAGQTEEAKKEIDLCLKYSKNESDHLTLAYRIFVRAGDVTRANDVKNKLKKINPYAAELL